MQSELLKRIISTAILLPLVLFFIIKGSYFFIFFTLLCFLFTSYEWHLLSKKKKYYYPGYIFIIFSFFSFYQLRYEYLGDLTLFVLLVCISTDVGGYIFGKIFRGPKLTKLSPNKTYAGAAGGYLISIVSTYYVSLIPKTFSDYSFQLFLICIIISTISQIGDIIISYFKRLSKTKDTGRIIPGHGGILDRIDGMLFVFPILYLLFLNINIMEYFFGLSF